jgi:GntR family transcriptional regulator
VLGMTEPLDFDSDVPVYEQIARRVTFAIARGAYGPKEQLPSVRGLARDLLVNPNTVSRVYRTLEHDGLVYTRRGKGVFVAPHAARRCRRSRMAIVEDRLREAISLGRQANLDDVELRELWRRLMDEDRG